MPEPVIRVVDVYPYRIAAGGSVSFLLLRRAADKVYAGSWRMVGGKIASGEKAWQAALREVREETGQEPARMWTVPSINAFYEWQHDRVNLIPAFAAEVSRDPVLNHEHDAYRWFSADEAVQHLAWPEQQRLLRLVDRLLIEGLRPEWVIDRGLMES